jgi:hypothetical protein
VCSFATDAHRFFLVLFLMLIPAALAAVSTKAHEPGYALDSVWIYRFEVGLAFFLFEYVLLLALWLAYQGRSIGKIELPGGGGIDMKNPAKQTADGFKEFRDTTKDQLANDSESIAWLTDLAAPMPQPEDGFLRRVRWVLFGYARPQDRPDPREPRGEPETAQADE